ncbi:cytochrome c oxidase assembly factor 7 homolog [Ctenocephalides felis]|uniref:cytochrome c oxidase assembly factor 7 homolog n=1 Tax=Ctenocephalides felis TaxID=7515 RepID=UPI000E6E24CA|nr:cytochrome c oxidase assembly factor 7 homolog [Ctenocephalides felis]XP_026469172.1 cytochrome c oxidase assembly factor 7 homolog [Ctenocephalides felis]
MSYDLQNEESVKEYLENLGIEYRFGCYHEKKPEVCHLLADYFEAIKKDFEKAGKVYQTNCDDSGHGKSCFKFGSYSLLGKGVKKTDHKTAVNYFEKGCKSGDPDACLYAGLIRTSNTPIPEVDHQFENGLRMLEKSCDSKNGNACYYMSGLYMSGYDSTKFANRTSEKDSKNISNFKLLKDMKKAFEFSEKACALRNIYACANLSQMYRRGDGVVQNDELADKFKQLTLDMQDEIKKQQPELSFQQ